MLKNKDLSSRSITAINGSLKIIKFGVSDQLDWKPFFYASAKDLQYQLIVFKMNQFELYLKMGFEHIADVAAYDHIVFLVALCAIYSLKAWKEVLILVTAFTLGHSLTLALAVLDLIRFSPDVIETLIPVTILITCLYNVIFHKEEESLISRRWHYLLALVFGLIHGMGFSNFLRSMLMPGEESQLLTQLLAFNLGVELGQIVIVLIILGLSFVLLEILKVKQLKWNLFVSGAAFGIAITLLL